MLSCTGSLIWQTWFVLHEIVRNCEAKLIPARKCLRCANPYVFLHGIPQHALKHVFPARHSNMHETVRAPSPKYSTCNRPLVFLGECAQHARDHLCYCIGIANIPKDVPALSYSTYTKPYVFIVTWLTCTRPYVFPHEIAQDARNHMLLLHNCSKHTRTAGRPDELVKTHTHNTTQHITS